MEANIGGSPGERLLVAAEPSRLARELVEVAAAKEGGPGLQSSYSQPLSPFGLDLDQPSQLLHYLDAREAAVGSTQRAQPLGTVRRRCKPRLAALLVWSQWHEVPSRLREILDAAARLREVPVDHPHEPIVAPDAVPRAEIPVTDYLAVRRRPRRAPDRVGRGAEVAHEVVVGAQRSPQLDQSVAAAQHARPRS